MKEVEVKTVGLGWEDEESVCEDRRARARRERCKMRSNGGGDFPGRTFPSIQHHQSSVSCF